MTSFSEQALLKHLNKLDNSQQSIQSLSLWLIHHRKHAKAIAKIWWNELKKVSPKRQLTFVYLCNDVVQSGRKSAPEFGVEFSEILFPAFTFLLTQCDSKLRQSYARIVDVWTERNVFPKQVLSSLSTVVHAKPDRKRSSEAASLDSVPEEVSKPNSSFGLSSFLASGDLVKDLGSFLVDDQEPPEVDKLVSLLLELEKSASSDLDTREKISSIPPTVTDPHTLKIIKESPDSSEARQLVREIEDSHHLMTAYNDKLEAEVRSRRKLSGWLATYLKQQIDFLKDDVAQLRQHEERMKVVEGVYSSLQSHLSSLPDISKMAGSDLSLPELRDLFQSS